MCLHCHRSGQVEKFLRENYVAVAGCKGCGDHTFIQLPFSGELVDKWMDDGNGTIRVRHKGYV